MGGPSRVRVTGPLAEYADGFAAWLAELGYTPMSAANQLRVMARLSRWLVVSGLAPAGLTARLSPVPRTQSSRRTSGRSRRDTLAR